ncbi:sulfatase [Alienimonas chondri]|uniref:Choline-sulfatase n=1 Tax=Alienimonas chondri TaxID=2681879 RepID=A0ABX1VBQ1_9PLAN|nr:sulfatase [Alienimonas chondri]NNJ24722.1 Choline-sulfatase [Alienimonas chondri]
MKSPIGSRRLLATVLLGVAALPAAAADPDPADDRRPNVVFLAVDDMNDYAGFLESAPRAVTPNLDRLAARGVNFTNAHTAGVYCAPSRAAIFSGQFASTTGCYTSAEYFVHRPEIEPLQVSFDKAGYRTLGAGKLFHHPAGAIDIRGWDEFFLRTDRQRQSGWPLDSWAEPSPLPDPFPNSVYNADREITGGLFLEWAALPNDREGEMADTQRVDWAVETLRDGLPEDADAPFFLGVGLYAPHYPNYCPQKYFDLYDRDAIELPPVLPGDRDDLPPKIQRAMRNRVRISQRVDELDALRDALHGYLACISYADAQLGRILDAVAARGDAENTVVVLWSDHGYHHGQKGQWGKHTLWERTSNVPFVWAGPGVAAGTEVDATVSLIDLYPTLVDLCGLPAPRQTLEGQSLASVLADPAEAEDRRVFLPDVTPGEYAVITRDWRYIRRDDGEELYDLSADPHEWRNLAGDPARESVKERLRARAPETFAAPNPKLNARRDLVVEGDRFRWEKGEGNAPPARKANDRSVGDARGR